jgi:hypothetical protein
LLLELGDEPRRIIASIANQQQRLQQLIVESETTQAAIKTIFPINVLVNNLWPPTFIKGNTTLQKLRINEIQSRINSYNDENRWNIHQDIYTVFLQGIPYMIKKNIERHWKEMFQNFYKEEDFVTDKSWPPNCNDANEKRDKSGSEKRYNPNINYDPSMKNFEILLSRPSSCLQL